VAQAVPAVTSKPASRGEGEGIIYFPSFLVRTEYMESEFRQLNERERELLEILLAAEFPARDEWRTQLDSITGKQVIEDGTLILRCSGGVPLYRQNI
jgi:hypothetical protein